MEISLQSHPQSDNGVFALLDTVEDRKENSLAPHFCGTQDMVVRVLDIPTKRLSTNFVKIQNATRTNCLLPWKTGKVGVFESQKPEQARHDDDDDV